MLNILAHALLIALRQDNATRALGAAARRGVK